MELMKKIVNHSVVRWLSAIIWTIILSVLLLQPENQAVIPKVVQPAPPSLKRELFFSSIHLLTFGFTAFLWCFALDIKADSKRNLFIIGMMLLSFGLSVEYLQSSIPGRSSQWWDMLANSIGIIGACAIWLWFQKQINLVQFKQIHQVSG